MSDDEYFRKIDVNADSRRLHTDLRGFFIRDYPRVIRDYPRYEER